MCVCVRACVYVPGIVSRDKILHFKIFQLLLTVVLVVLCMYVHQLPSQNTYRLGDNKKAKNKQQQQQTLQLLLDFIFKCLDP